MRPTVHITFGATEIVAHPPLDDAGWTSEQARRWLDDKFTGYECEPLRASGKVLTADKVLAVANAIGQHGFEADEQLRVDFARAATAALARPVVHIDVDARTISS